jgi:hypothetical protein
MERRITVRFARLIASSSVLCVVAVSPATSLPSQKSNDARYPCQAVHTFDFSVGTFDATPWNQPTASPAGRLQNTREYEGCVIVERWSGVTGSAGMSMSFYDTNRHAWRMIWNDDSNQSNDFEGEYRDGAMRFKGWMLDGVWLIALCGLSHLYGAF